MPSPTGKRASTDVGYAFGQWSQFLRVVAKVEPQEIRAVSISFVYFFCLMASYFILRPLRDAMGTVYGVQYLQELFTGTFVVTFVVAPLYAELASRIKLSLFLPLVYVFIAATMIVFYVLFMVLPEDRYVAAGFYVWTSTFNLLTISVFWSLMADIFSKTAAKRVYGIIAAGGTLGTICAPAFTAMFVGSVGADALLLISASGFLVTALLVRVLEREKQLMGGDEGQKTTLDHRLGGNPFDGFLLLFTSPYLLMIALFLLLMATISTVIYFQMADLITKSFNTRDERTQAYAAIDLATNVIAVMVQLFGTSRFLSRFGVTAGLLLNPVIMVWAFMAVTFSPGLLVLSSIQVIRRFTEYAVAKPSRDMLFTVVDQQSKYKAKNVIDTVVYRFGDVISAWFSSFILPYGVAGLAIAGVAISAIWFPIAFILGRQYDAATQLQDQEKYVGAKH
jgi:AAA family ATP:ADP antiporter